MQTDLDSSRCATCWRLLAHTKEMWSSKNLARLRHRARHPELHVGLREVLVCRACSVPNVPLRELCIRCGEVLTYHGEAANCSRAQKGRPAGDRRCKPCVWTRQYMEAHSCTRDRLLEAFRRFETPLAPEGVPDEEGDQPMGHESD